MTPQDKVVRQNLGQEFEIGTNVANKVTIKTDGTSVVRAADGTLHGATPTYDNTTAMLQFPAVNGVTPPAIDLSALTTDIFVTGGSLDGTTNVLTLTDPAPGTPDVVIDLSALKGVSADANNVLVDGSDGKPMLTAAAVAATTDLVCQDLFGNQLFRAFTV